MKTISIHKIKCNNFYKVAANWSQDSRTWSGISMEYKTVSTYRRHKKFRVEAKDQSAVVSIVNDYLRIWHGGYDVNITKIETS